MTQIVVADVGGTHARFALAEIDDDRPIELGVPVVLRTAEHATFESAWEAFEQRSQVDLPRDLAIAVAGPLGGEALKFTNNPWVIRPPLIRERLAVDRLTIVNDFGAVAHAVAILEDEHLRHLFGPEESLPREGVITIVGPGTGLGVAALLRQRDRYDVIETEGGHIDFAPLDSLDDKILIELRRSFGRVSVERMASGRGLWNLYKALCAIEGCDTQFADEMGLWTAALAGSDSLANAALERLCQTLGAAAGDLALAQGASAVVLAGGVGLRLAHYLPGSGFQERFTAKGRFEKEMRGMPVKLITYAEPGLLGAAAAFAREHRNH
jgi:glucokinase